MAEASEEPLLFENGSLQGAHFENVDLSDVWFRNVFMQRTRITGAWMEDIEIDAGFEGAVTVNGVDIVPLVEAELNRRHPGRATVTAVRTSDADGFRAAWGVIEDVWAGTVERMRRVPEEQLHEELDGEWSVIQNLRHLAFAIDAWVKAAMQGDPAPWDPLDLPHSELGPVESIPNDLDARPSLDDALALHASRMATARAVIERLTDEQLAGQTEPNHTAGYPPPAAHDVRRCLRAVVGEEWEHRRYIERILDELEAG
jgi:hypothetical protein